MSPDGHGTAGSNQLLRTTNLTIHQQPSAPEAERDVVEALIETHPMKAGEVWFLISCRWFNHWKRYVRYQQRPSYSEFEGKPGPIDNAVLIERNGDLNRFATERTDYELINGIEEINLKYGERRESATGNVDESAVHSETWGQGERERTLETQTEVIPLERLNSFDNGYNSTLGEHKVCHHKF
ncbi:hypothetical protein Pelo_1417 [Pelomyxa schiedti]|nr:hypothetical protein Pelo_1417 [Pelomyxa schiedti]